MTQITKYRATDGTEWNSVEECAKRNDLCEKIRVVMETLGENKDVCVYTAWIAKENILGICREEARNCYSLELVAKNISDRNWPLNIAWNRLFSIDPDGLGRQ